MITIRNAPDTVIVNVGAGFERVDNGKILKSEKHHDTVKNTSAHFMSGTDSGQEIADLTDGIEFVEEHSFNEELKKYSIRGKIFVLLLPKMNDRWATFML